MKLLSDRPRKLKLGDREGKNSRFWLRLIRVRGHSNGQDNKYLGKVIIPDL